MMIPVPFPVPINYILYMVCTLYNGNSEKIQLMVLQNGFSSRLQPTIVKPSTVHNRQVAIAAAQPKIREQPPPAGKSPVLVEKPAAAALEGIQILRLLQPGKYFFYQTYIEVGGETHMFSAQFSPFIPT